MIGAIVLSGCLGERIDPATQLPAGHDEHHDGSTAPTPELGPPDVTLEAHAGTAQKDLEIHPDRFQVPLGSIVEIRVGNQGTTTHTFTLQPFSADTGILAPGEERAIKFRASEAGEFEIRCDVPGHYQAGMRSTLEVTA